MSNELKDIAERLNRYADEGWEITSAEKLANGGWRLDIQPIAEKEAEPQEATDDNN